MFILQNPAAALKHFQIDQMDITIIFFFNFRKRYNVEVFKKIASKHFFFFMLEFARNFDVNEMEP